MAEEFWERGSAEQLQSDFWTETDAEGKEYHLLAYRDDLRGRGTFWRSSAPMRLITSTSSCRLYAHEMVMQYETITRLNGEVERATRAKTDFWRR